MGYLRGVGALVMDVLSVLLRAQRVAGVYLGGNLVGLFLLGLGTMDVRRRCDAVGVWEYGVMAVYDFRRGGGRSHVVYVLVK